MDYHQLQYPKLNQNSGEQTIPYIHPGGQTPTGCTGLLGPLFDPVLLLRLPLTDSTTPLLGSYTSGASLDLLGRNV